MLYECSWCHSAEIEADSESQAAEKFAEVIRGNIEGDQVDVTEIEEDA